MPRESWVWEVVAFVAGWALGLVVALAVLGVADVSGDARTLAAVVTSTFVGSFCAAGAQWARRNEW